MVLELPAPAPQVGLFLSQQLSILRAGVNPSLIGANIANDTGRANSQGDIPSTRLYPRGWWVRDTNTTYVFISGSETLLQAEQYVHYVSGPESTIANGQRLRNYFSDASENYLTPIQAPDIEQAGTILFAGHSLGGVFAQRLIPTAKVRRVRTAQAAVTFGSPKFARNNEREFLNGLNITRWMVDNDPVPSCPPNVITNIRALASVSFFTVENWSITFQLAGGVSVNTSGITDDLPIPPMGSVNFASSLANWLWDIYNGRETVHDLPEYERRLTLVVARVIPPLSARVVESGPEPVERLDRRSANRVIQTAVDSIVHVAALQNASQLGVPPDRAFKPVKLNGIWWVLFGGQLVAVGPRRRNVGLMCRRGNEFLRRLQRMGGVDGSALTTLFQDYILAASTPDNGFTPPIARLDDF